MRTFNSLAALAVLSACATSGSDMQAECEVRHTSFSDIYACTRAAVAARNPTILRDARAKLYLLRGEQLAGEVSEGRMSNIDAKVHWQRLFVDLKSANDQEVLAAIGTMGNSLVAVRATVPAPPAPTSPSPVNCTSTVINSSVFTNCR